MNWQILFAAMLPQHLLLAGIVVLLLAEILLPRPQGSPLLAALAVAAAAAAAFLLQRAGFQGTPFPGQYAAHPTQMLAVLVMLLLALPAILLARAEFRAPRYYALLLSSLYGASLLPGSESFLTLFLGLEIMSLPVYALVVMAFRRTQAPEAALKYLVLGGVATAVLLMGVSLQFGATGSLALGRFETLLNSSSLVALTAAVLVVLAFFVKASIVPFHTWAPDAYEAASLPATAYMVVLVKAAVLFALLRVLGQASVTGLLVGVFGVLSVASIVWGNLVAMRQTSLRRLIAYSSVAHAGYLVLALLGPAGGRFQSVTLYLLAYGAMNLLLLASLPADEDDERRDRVEGLRGLFQRSPYAAVMIAIAVLSLAGIPPLPGFIAKFLVFAQVMAAGHVALAVAGLVASYLGIYFYLRIVQLMFMSPTPAHSGAPLAAGAVDVATGLLCLLPAVAVSLFPGWVLGQL